ncbi:tyrosine-type recombinase/integrase [Phenylobacterium sp.]|uniref:tyrosine-type recombinase/integrase n=1 Tax=Phenylobacterium sp. TaxID=1871053 RepID=UPI002735E00E|nr:tyrosine-type recombinase/integrase [Phenylobacterium sp.]MDP3853653.1 tyrosine-type recombinase/integrase [Phenylobacterium sp.]
MLPGVHRVRVSLAGGRRREYWYAWRGGPRILEATAQGDAALDREVARLTPRAAAAYEAERSPRADNFTFYGLITRYLVHLESDGKLGARTKSDRRKHLDVARADLGTMELQAFESRKARGFLITWRDGYKATPKTADDRLAAVGAVLQWAADRGELAGNPVKDFPRIYKVDRADIIWRTQDLAVLLAHAAPEFDHAVRLAGLTALRESDLIGLPWSAVGENAIIWQTGKSRRRKTVVIPITPPLRALLSAIPRRDAVTVLTSSRGLPWTISGLAAALRRARQDALKLAREKAGDPAAVSGIEGLRWHDLRGTAATNFILAGLTLDEVAMILGWKLDRVKEIAARYVSGEAMGMAMIRRLKRNERRDRDT